MSTSRLVQYISVQTMLQEISKCLDTKAMSVAHCEFVPKSHATLWLTNNNNYGESHFLIIDALSHGFALNLMNTTTRCSWKLNVKVVPVDPQPTIQRIQNGCVSWKRDFKRITLFGKTLNMKLTKGPFTRCGSGNGFFATIRGKCSYCGAVAAAK